MFDYVHAPKVECPYCHNEIPENSEWQSKDGECMLEVIDWKDVDRLYTNCPTCGEWVEFTREEQRGKFLEGFEVSPNWKYVKNPPISHK